MACIHRYKEKMIIGIFVSNVTQQQFALLPHPMVHESLEGDRFFLWDAEVHMDATERTSGPPLLEMTFALLRRKRSVKLDDRVLLWFLAVLSPAACFDENSDDDDDDVDSSFINFTPSACDKDDERLGLVNDDVTGVGGRLLTGTLDRPLDVVRPNGLPRIDFS